MPWDLDNDRPIYLQIMERIQQDIISGVYKPGDKLPSVRDLATLCRRLYPNWSAADLYMHSGPADVLSRRMNRCSKR